MSGMKVTVKTDLTTLQLEKGVWQDFATAQGSVGKPDYIGNECESDVRCLFKEAAGLQFTARLAAAQLK